MRATTGTTGLHILEPRPSRFADLSGLLGGLRHRARCNSIARRYLPKTNWGVALAKDAGTLNSERQEPRKSRWRKLRFRYY